MNTKIKSISIDGYKNILDSFSPLTPLTVIVGPNNSGKSNFLEVFNLISRLFFGSDETRKSIFNDGISLREGSIACHLNQCKYKPIKVSVVIESKILSDETYDIEYSMELQCTDRSNKKENLDTGYISEEITFKERSRSGKPRTLVKRTRNNLECRKPDGKFATKKIEANIPAYTAVQVLYPEYKKLDENTLKAFYSLIFAISTAILFVSPNDIRKAIGEGEKYLFNEPKISSFDIVHEIYKIHENKIIFEEFKNTLISILGVEKVHFDSIKIPKEIMESQKIEKDRVNFFRLQMPGQPPAPISEFSDGTLMVISILLGIISPERKFSLLCIEEPENCIHPSALKALINYIKEKSKYTQFIITTHSPYIINLIDPKNILVAEVKETGGTSFNPIPNLKELHKILRNGYISFGDLLENQFVVSEGEDF